MKSTLIVILALMLASPVYTQTPSGGIPMSISYFSFLGYQPGAKIGTEFGLKHREGATANAQKQLYISPQIGFFTNPNVHTSYLANLDFGYRMLNNQKQRYGAFSVGLGYLLQSQVTGWSVRLADGEKVKQRENWGWFLPTLNYEFGKTVNEKLTWFSKFSYGLKISSARESSSLFLIELGLRFPLLR